MHVNRKQCSRTGPHVASPYSPPLVAFPFSPPLVPLNFSTSASPPVLYIVNSKANNLHTFTQCWPAGKMMSANESMEFKDTELTLGLPGTTSDYNHPRVFGGFNFKISSTNSSSVKRGFMDTIDQISLQKSSTASEPRGSSSSSTSSSTTTSVIKAAAAKARIAGWPPVRSMRQKSLVVVESSRKYVKVSADGAPYLRKLDLEMYKSYQELLRALEQMFPSLTISGKCIEDGNEVMKPAVKGMDQYMLTNEDKDGDWMLVGDVPWKMFIESCKRIRLMKSSDAVGIAPRAPIPS